MHVGPNGMVITTRSNDWVGSQHSNLWVYPRGMSRDGVAHLSISDPSGDSAIFEYVDGKFVSGEVTRHFRTTSPFGFAGVKN